MKNSFENSLSANIDSKSEDIEEKLYQLVDKLPEGPKKVSLLNQIEEVDESQLVGLYNEVERILKKINDAKKYIFSEYPEEEDFSNLDNNCEELQQIIKARAKQVVKEAMENKMIHLGNGYTAGVFASKTCPEYCYKIITDPIEYKKSKTVKEEIAFMDLLSDLEIDGVRIPKPVCYRMSKEAHILVMETLDAITIDTVKDMESMEGVIENFDFERFFSSLEKYLEKMHERGIHHRDMHNKNIMIDKKTGLARVIDFGKSIKTGLINQEEIYTDISVRGDTRYTPDGKYLNQHKNALMKFKNK